MTNKIININGQRMVEIHIPTPEERELEEVVGELKSLPQVRNLLWNIAKRYEQCDRRSAKTEQFREFGDRIREAMFCLDRAFEWAVDAEEEINRRRFREQAGLNR